MPPESTALDECTDTTAVPNTWRNLAACRGRDPRVFFVGEGQSAEPARRICRDCPVRIDCLEYALSLRTVDDAAGIFGGHTMKERRAIRATRRRRTQETA